MAIEDAKRGMSLLEGMKQFDYGKTTLYASTIRLYVERKIATYGETSPTFVDVTNGSIELPVEFVERIEQWMKHRPELSPFMRTFAKYYILSLMTGQSFVYEPLAECVAQGGDFYNENGIFLIRDAARVSSRL